MVKMTKQKWRDESAMELRLLVNPKSTETLRTFSEKATEILVECKSRREAKAPKSVFESGTSYLKTECYILIKNYMHWEKRQPIKELSRYDNRDNRQPTYEQNSFYWGLLAIDPIFSQIPEKHVHAYAQQLLYAHLHQVPPEHLVGFLHQSGSPSRLNDKILRGFREDQFLKVRNRTRSSR
jgi:hypothetical protein